MLETAFEQLLQTSLMEGVAVVLAIAYLLLAMKQHIACWYCAFASTALFLFIFFDVNLYMETALQVYYLAMAVYGWWQWKHAGPNQDAELRISTWHWQRHVLVITGVLIATAISGTLLQSTDQRLGYLDSFTTWGAVVTTIMVAWKVLENWIYWLVIDALSIYLYLDRELYFTALLFAAYIVIVIVGFWYWLKDYRQQTS